MNEIVTQRDFILYAILLNQGGNPFKRYLKDEEFLARMRQGDNTAVGAVTEGLSTI